MFDGSPLRQTLTSALPLILFAVGVAVVGQVALKSGMQQVGRIDGESVAQPLVLAARVATNPLVLAGLGLYVLGAVAWLTVLSRVPLSFAYPMLALSYALTPLVAWLVLREPIPSIRWVGIAVIVLGVSIVARS